MSESQPEKVEDQVDPRVQVELERLNTATDDINKLEVELDEAKSGFRQLLCESSNRIDHLSKKLGSSVEKAKPYYEARITLYEMRGELQNATMRFERASSAHAAAKEMVYLAEEGLIAQGRTFDHAWQEMLNHATMRVNESELERTMSEAQHKKIFLTYQVASNNVHHLQTELKRSISKSRLYYETKAHFNKMLEEQKQQVKVLEKKVNEAKQSYSDALSNLEHISDEIHKLRNLSQPGLGLFGIACKPDSTGSSSSDTETTGSPDSSYPAEEFLRLPLPERTFSSTTNPGPDYKLLNNAKEMSPISPCFEECLDNEPHHVEDSRCAPNQASISPGPVEDTEEWSEISLDPDSSVAQAAEVNNPNNTPITAIRISDSLNSSPRRASIDTFITGGLATGERVKEMLSHGIMKLNISSLTERRNSDPRPDLSLKRNDGFPCVDVNETIYCDSGLSIEMLTDEQIASLMLDQDIAEAYRDMFSAMPLKK